MSPEDLSFTVKAEFVSAGKLDDHRIAFTRYSSTRKGGVADVVSSQGQHLEGVLLSVPSFRRLDAREGHPYVYYRTPVNVFNYASGEFVEAYTYKVVDPLMFEVKPSENYASLMLDSADKFLSKDYASNLRTVISSLEEYDRDRVVRYTGSNWKSEFPYREYKFATNFGSRYKYPELQLSGFDF